MARNTLEPGPGFGVGRGFAIRGPFPVQAPDKAPETCTWSTRSADRGSQVSALGVGLPSGTPFRCRHRIKHRKRAPGQRGLRVGANLLSRNLDGNQIAWKYRRCAGHANLLFRDDVKRQVGKCDCLLEFTTRPELSQSRARIWPQQHVPKRLKNSATRNSRLGSSPGNTCLMGWDFLNCLFPPCWGGLSPQTPFHGGNRHGLSGYFVYLGHAM